MNFGLAVDGWAGPIVLFVLISLVSLALSKKGLTALSMAIRREQVPIVAFLLECGANPDLQDFMVRSSLLNI